MLDSAPHKPAPNWAEVVAYFTGYLQRLRYRPSVIGSYAHAVEHFASWLLDERMEITQLQDALVARFLESHLPHCHCPGRPQRTKVTVRSALRHLLKALRLKGTIAPPAPRISAPLGADLDAFSAYMRQVCGLAENTVISRRLWVARFLQHQFSTAPFDIAELTPGDLSGFVTTQCAGFQPGSVRVVGSALRCYLRFRSVHRGDAVERLLAAVPTVAQWPQATIPKHLSSGEVELWLRAFDRRTPNGKRDYAMARCLADLGLRACEVAALRLDDLNWDAGTMTINASKSRRADILPLPVVTGTAITEYLSEGRPHSSGRQLFVRHCAPFDEPVRPGLVRGSMRRAAARCGLPVYWSGPHVLRHTVAARLLGGGASRKEIADLLRHRSLDTTAIYAKVDVSRLMRVTQPWPGGVA